MSALAWVAFIICAAAVALHYTSTGDSRFLLYAIPGLILLLVIPMALAWMSRRSFTQADDQFNTQARGCTIGKIGPAMVGDVVRISGEVQKISFRWLNRPHFHIKDETAQIRVIMFTAPANKVVVGDRVETVGIVMKYPLTKTRFVISAVSVKKIED
ncbi:MAG: OB-fold nucleic acid binding domain-containing protein [Deltaproteobacteria bacterium]|nr:OB-fold nucleic acid binding domain-containing protein [Deltaproteobacteria bacterium]